MIIAAGGGVAALAATLAGFMWMATLTSSDLAAATRAPGVSAPAPYIDLAPLPEAHIAAAAPAHARPVRTASHAAPAGDLFSTPALPHVKVTDHVATAAGRTPPPPSVVSTPTPPTVPVPTPAGVVGGLVKTVGGLLGSLL